MIYLPILLRSIIIMLIVLALARPRISHKQQIVHGHGLDIMLVIDVSGSMQALDFKPDNRLEAARQVSKNFVKKRVNDRIGIVAFAPYAYTLSPITHDHDFIMRILRELDFPSDPNGTAIGMGLATAVARIKDSEAESKVIVLITDGLNNSGEIDPITAAHLANKYNIRVYPIAIGTDKEVDFPYVHPVYGRSYRKVKIDFDIETLHQIAQITGTDKAWHAESTEEFAQILEEIDKLEKYEFTYEHFFYYDDKFQYFVIIALIMLIIEFLFRTVFIKRLP